MHVRELNKKIDMALLRYSEAWKKMIHEKKPEVEKSRETVSFTLIKKKIKVSLNSEWSSYKVIYD